MGIDSWVVPAEKFKFLKAVVMRPLEEPQERGTWASVAKKWNARIQSQLNNIYFELYLQVRCSGQQLTSGVPKELKFPFFKKKNNNYYYYYKKKKQSIGK